MDQQVVRQRTHFRGALPKQFRVLADISQPAEPHAPLDPPQHGRLFVAVEILARTRSQHCENLTDVLMLAREQPRSIGFPSAARIRMLCIRQQNIGDIGGAQYVVGIPRVDQMPGH